MRGFFGKFYPWGDIGRRAISAFGGRAGQNRIAAQLRQAQRMEAVGQLTGGMAHDFNNLLGVIVGNIDLARGEVGEDHPASALLDAALAACQRGAQLNHSLLAFSRQQDLQPQRLDPVQILRDARKIFSHALGERIEIELVAGDDVQPLRADRAQLDAALLNLALNARDAMPQGGMLTLAAENAVVSANSGLDLAPGEYVSIIVSDTGEGMSPDVLARVFEPFFTTKDVGKGSGLGLSMVYGFVKQSNGQVGIQSKPGIGTVVRLYLPKDFCADEVADDGVLAAKDVEMGHSELVLVVEDNEGLRQIAVSNIRRLGYQVIEAASSAAALAALEGGVQPDILFTDVIMPGCSVSLDGRRAAPEYARGAHLRIHRPEFRAGWPLALAAAVQALSPRPTRRGVAHGAGGQKQLCRRLR